MKESSVTTGEKEEKSKQELAEKVFFPVVAAKQKAYGADADPSLLWCGVAACLSSVSFCDPAQSSSNPATSWRREGWSRVCLLVMEAGRQNGGRQSKVMWQHCWWNHADTKKQGRIQVCLSKTSVLGFFSSNKQVPSLKIELQRSISLAFGASPPLSQSASLKTRLIHANMSDRGNQEEKWEEAEEITVKAKALQFTFIFIFTYYYHDYSCLHIDRNDFTIKAVVVVGERQKQDKWSTLTQPVCNCGSPAKISVSH